MTIQDLISTVYHLDNIDDIKLSYLIFGGQGSVYISSIEYCPAKKQLKLLEESKETYRGPVKLTDLFLYPKDTEILIEGYPGDKDNPQEWRTPDFAEYRPNDDNTLDFQHILDDNQRELVAEYKRLLHTMVENMESDGIPSDIITMILQQGTKGYLYPITNSLDYES